MAIALITHKRIKTTLPKAKALRKFIEPILTRAKDNTTHSRRVVFSYLQNKDAINELFDQVGPKIAERPGGYVRILKMGFRPSDAADVAIIELVDYNEAADATQEADKKRTRRRRKKKSSETAETVATEETTEEATEEAADNEEEKTEE